MRIVDVVATREEAKPPKGHLIRLGFLEAFRTFCLAPPVELRALMEQEEI